MIIIGIMDLSEYRNGASYGRAIAEEYVNMPAVAPKGMENGTMGLEEYYEARIKCLNVPIPGTQQIMNIKEFYKNRPQFLQGVWDGFVLYVRAFRYFKAHSTEELIDNMRKIAMEQQEQGQGQSDIDDADWWKDGKQKEKGF
jgi:hypothetical protein